MEAQCLVLCFLKSITVSSTKHKNFLHLASACLNHGHMVSLNLLQLLRHHFTWCLFTMPNTSHTVTIHLDLLEHAFLQQFEYLNQLFLNLIYTPYLVPMYDNLGNQSVRCNWKGAQNALYYYVLHSVTTITEF